MNVAIFTDSELDRVNGVTTALRAALHHAPRGLHLRVYTASALGVDAPNYLAVAAPALPIPFCREIELCLPRVGTFLRHAREDGIDVVHFTTAGPMGLAALRVAARLRLPIVGSLHADIASRAHAVCGSRHLASAMRQYTRWLYGKCTRVLVPCQHARRFVERATDAAIRADVWPSAVDADLFSPHRRLCRMRERWHVADNRPALLYVGRLSRDKGVGLLPGIQDALHALGMQHRFVIVGDGPLREDLQRRMPDAVFTGVRLGAALAEVYASADLYVCPGGTEASGLAVLEAQASGLPVVVSDEGGAFANMLPGRTGIVCSGLHPFDWAQQIATLLGPRLLRCEMGRAARDYATTRRWNVALQPLYQAYREAAASRVPSLPLASAFRHEQLPASRADHRT